MHIDLRVLELLSSKLCHDLISPVSAVNNGVELIEDIGGDVVGEAMKLIGDSAQQAARRLRLFRIAYGRAGSEQNLPVRDVRTVVDQYFQGGKIRLDWSENVDIQTYADHQGSLKVLINALLLAEETLAYGGGIALQRLDADDTIGCRIEVSGRNAQLSEMLQNALSEKTPVEELTPRTIQSFITGRFAAHFGMRVAFATPEADRLNLDLLVLPPAYDTPQSV
jgi:histidine phosphotransferase ChpT